MKILLFTIGIAIILGLAATYLYATPQWPQTSNTAPTAPLSASSLSVHPVKPRVIPQPVLASPPLATPVVGTPTATPVMIVVNTPTTVTVTASITPAPILNGVNLLRVGATGTQSTILGVMHDDGKNGDAVAGDGTYTLQVPINEATAGQIKLQVSAAFRALMMRAVSPTLIIHVTKDFTSWLAYTDESSGLTLRLPPRSNSPTANAGNRSDESTISC